jgi:hypothetical protein
MNRQLFIIQKSQNLPEGLRQALKTKGFPSTIIESVSEIEAAVGSINDFITLVYCDENTDKQTLLGELVELKLLHQNPIVLIGNNLDSSESFLNRHFILATTLTSPCSNNDVVSAVTYVIKYVDRIRKQRKPSEATEQESSRAFYKEFKLVPHGIFKKLDELGLFEKILGGAEYATTFRPQNLKEKYFYPQDEYRRECVEEITDSLDESQLSRFTRIALLSHKILTAVGLSENIFQDALTAANLYSYGFFLNSKTSASSEYFSESKIAMRKEVCSLVKDALISIPALSQFGETKEIIKRVGKFIGEEDTPDESSLSIAASAIATADAVDRVVFNRNVFQPVAAYCLLSKFKREQIPFMHPLVLGIVVKILAEAATSNASGIAITKKMKDVARLTQAASLIENQIIKQDEVAISISQLAPGMKLTQGVITYDGKSVLDEPVILDQDLIWRLWQLSSIRPLQEKVVVEKE